MNINLQNAIFVSLNFNRKQLYFRNILKYFRICIMYIIFNWYYYHAIVFNKGIQTG